MSRSKITYSLLLKPYRGRLALGFLYLLLTNLCALSLPTLMNAGVSLVENNAFNLTLLGLFNVSLSGINVVVSMMVAVAILGAIFRTLSRTTIFNVGRGVERDIRSKVYQHVSFLSSDFFTRYGVGELMSRLVNDVTNIRFSTGFALLNSLNIAFVFIGTVPILLAIDVKVALCALAPIPIVMICAQLLSRRIYAHSGMQQQALGRLTSYVQDNLNGAQVVRVFHQEEQEAQRFSRISQDVYQTSMKLAFIQSVMFSLVGVIGGLGIAVTLFAGGYAVLQNRITIGDFIEINTRLLQLTWPSVSLGFIISIYHRGRASLKRLNDILAIQAEIISGNYESSHVTHVSAENVSFSYAQTNHAVLSDVSFNLEHGMVLGIVGTSGSGKSTLVRLLARQSDVSSGQITFNGVDIRDWRLDTYRRLVAMVPQEPFLFSASIRDNIAFANPTVGDEEVWRAIRFAGLAEDISQLSEGIHTLVGERGVMLSGGQRQRVGIARAILAQPEVLILDDCLSAVDTSTQTHLLAEIRKLQVPFVAIVSHRLSAVQHADEILVLQQGKVCERGRHEDLIENGALYRSLWGKEQLEEALS